MHCSRLRSGCTPFAAPILLASCVALVPTGAPAEDGVGVNAHLAPDDVYDAVAELGVRWVRIDNNWFAHEPANGRYDWGELDRAVNRITGHGQRVFMTVAYTPAWAAEPGDPGGQAARPRAGLYERYVSAVVERYRDRVQHYGLWNEPNLEQFWSGSAEDYVERIVLPGSAAVHAACPECVVVGPDLAGLGGWQSYMERVLARGGAAFDIISHHTYAAPPPVHGGWICDDFAHAMDNSADPICFYKPGLRQILAEFATTRDKTVWLTETGHQAEPWDSDVEQRRQVQYMDGVLDLQRATPWWTATFFYEALDCRPVQPDCPIDGFGFMRRQGGPDATWDDNFLLKPVFEALRDRLADDPVLRGEDDAPPPPPPPPRTLGARPRRAGPLMADRAAYAAESCLVVPDYIALTAPRTGEDDLWVMACAGWTPDALYLAFEVVDERHDNGQPDERLWLGDSVQIAIDPADDALEGAAYGPDDAEITVGLVGGDARVFVSPGALAAEAAARRQDGRTFYEVRLPGAAPDASPGARVHLSFLVNDADGRGRDGFLQWTPGIGLEKHPASFGYVELWPAEGEPPPPPVDAGAPPPVDAGAATRDAAPGPGTGPATDAGAPSTGDGGPDAARGAPEGGLDAGAEWADAARGPVVAADAAVLADAAPAGHDAGCQAAVGRARALGGPAAALLGLLALIRRRRTPRVDGRAADFTQSRA